eukprot:10662209-Ditylum_brightwellii.AAC.1
MTLTLLASNQHTRMVDVCQPTNPVKGKTSNIQLHIVIRILWIPLEEEAEQSRTHWVHTFGRGGRTE